MDDSAESFFQSFLREAVVNSSVIGRDADSLTLSIQHWAVGSGEQRKMEETDCEIIRGAPTTFAVNG